MKLSDLLFDRCCRLCSSPVDEGAVCSKCDENLKSISHVRTRSLFVDGIKFEARYLFGYENNTVKRLLFALKRCPDKDLFEYASRFYIEAVPEDFCGTVTNVPRRRITVRSAGFDQVLEPCKIMCRNNPTRLRFAKLLKRRGFSREQKNLASQQRINNVSGKFRIITKDIPKNILLVDDVVTTGSTAVECAREILRSRSDAKITFVFLASRN